MDLLKDNERLDDLQINNLYIIQNSNGYCFTSDAVRLANFATVKNGGVVVDLCSGSGVVGILVSAKNRVKKTYFVELQENLADMCRRTIKYNHLENDMEVLTGDLKHAYRNLGEGFADTIVCNPPYFKKNEKTLVNESTEKAIARHEISTNLDEIVESASRLIKYGGKFYIVNKEDRLVEVFLSLKKYNFEPKILKIEKAKGSNIILVGAVYKGKSGIKIIVE